ncbi:MAG: UdgX family uracil-DNA binding protein [Phycisphaerales bacterium]
MPTSTSLPCMADPRGDFARFCTLAASLLDRHVPPDEVEWTDTVTGGAPTLFGTLATELDNPADDDDATRASGEDPDARRVAAGRAASRVAQRLGSKGEAAGHHSEPERWAWLYRLVWRAGPGGEPGVLGDVLDPDVRHVDRLARQVRTDLHKMKAFVRFQRVGDADDERYVAWHRPDHRIVRLAAPFFVRRFGLLRWTIFTADESADWDGRVVRYGDGVPAGTVNEQDAMEDLWRTYYASIFNPARIKLQMMTREMPKRYWSTLPEASIIEQLIQDAPERVRRMVTDGNAPSGAATFVPRGDVSLPVLAQHVQDCAGCSIQEMATQAVFGEGPSDARIMLVGEQPGDEEDREGRPFVGPAGQLLDAALATAGLERRAVYVTNAVKHFKYEPRGGHRLHVRASASEVRACRPWLVREINMVDPDVIVLLGATAGQSIFGAAYRVGSSRATWMEHPAFRGRFFGTVHPSLLLRTPESARPAAIDTFVADLRRAKAKARQVA